MANLAQFLGGIMRAILALLLLAGISADALAQHHSHANGYAGMKAREIKALSSEQIGQLRDGKGMGLSLPAELNRYPGPMHALELRDALSLTRSQQNRISAIYDTMSATAKALGADIIAAEAKLDRIFAASSATWAEVSALLSEIAILNGQLRAVHILAHMENREALNQSQIERYDTERGYGSTAAAPPQHKH